MKQLLKPSKYGLSASGKPRKHKMTGLSEYGVVKEGQVWSINRGANKGWKSYVVCSISRNPCGIVTGRRVYMTGLNGGRMVNLSYDRLLRGLECRRIE